MTEYIKHKIIGMEYWFSVSSYRFNVTQEPDIKVIVDVDAGVDDAMALLLLLAADTQKMIKILGITCTHGNTNVKNVCVNVLRILGTMGRFDVSMKNIIIILLINISRENFNLNWVLSSESLGFCVSMHTTTPFKFKYQKGLKSSSCYVVTTLTSRFCRFHDILNIIANNALPHLTPLLI